MSKLRTCVFAVGLGTALTGCQNSSSRGDLANLTEDANNNGFADIAPPPGVPFDTETNVNVRLASRLQVADLASHAAQVGVSEQLLPLGTFTVNFTFTLTYDNGATSVISESEPLAPFEKKFEVACPSSADLSVQVVVTVPFLGNRPFLVIPVDLTTAVVDYTCGQTVEFETFVNDSGQVDETVVVSNN